MHKTISHLAAGLLLTVMLINPAVLPTAALAQDQTDPLSSMVAVTLKDAVGTGATNIAEFVKARVNQFARGHLAPTIQFPLANAATDSVRALQGLHHNVVIKWLDNLTFSNAADAPRFGANCDYLAYFGDGWNAVPGNAPQYNGSGSAGWVWVNHEYISGEPANTTTAPTNQHLTLAKFLRARGQLTNDIFSNIWSQADVDTITRAHKRQLGGSWFRVVQDPSTGEWVVDKNSRNVRYDATSNTLVRVAGQALLTRATDDNGNALPEGVVPGITGDCSGLQTPWGTIITAEENVQDYYGDLEACWTSQNRFVPGQGFDPGSNIAPPIAPSLASEFGRLSNPNERHSREYYGYLVEIDPGVAPGEYEGKTTPGVGHKKLGFFGRARWENAAVAVDGRFQLIADRPIVMYAGDDRRSGRIYKWVTRDNYVPGMSKAEIRALLENGKLYVAHFAGLDNTTGITLLGGGTPTEQNPGIGRWIELSVNSTDIAPNAAALGNPNKTVGEALRDVNWNGIGGFATDDDVRRALFTASNKIGIMELNRPEDIEWNPKDPSGTPRLYVAFTNHTGQVALDQNGVLFDPATHATRAPRRTDRAGSIFAIEESQPNNPGASRTFRYFAAWLGSRGQGAFDAANPDNLMIDRDGGVWFGTDGNYGTNGTADALYYLDLNPSHKAGVSGIVNPTFGKAIRVVAGPSDSEATGPAFSSDMRTLFFNVQHPGENVPSTWPQTRSSGKR